MSEAQKSKGKVFKDLHSADGIFVMPNAWNAGSACMPDTELCRFFASRQDATLKRPTES